MNSWFPQRPVLRLFSWGYFLLLLPAGLLGGDLIPLPMRWVRGPIDLRPSIHPIPGQGIGAGKEGDWQGPRSARTKAMALLLEKRSFH